MDCDLCGKAVRIPWRIHLPTDRRPKVLLYGEFEEPSPQVWWSVCKDCGSHAIPSTGMRTDSFWNQRVWTRRKCECGQWFWRVKPGSYALPAAGDAPALTYCSERCYARQRKRDSDERRRAKREAHGCAICGASLVNEHGNARYCRKHRSSRHRSVVHRQRRPRT